ncbi:MAG: DEAD/DEAH box helicase [Chitinispirillaceae bacterium]|nr:DEAD/DEAH box helicase [Chitinispirillaceae bacterium]
MTATLSSTIEFFRNAFVLVPEKDSDDHETILIPAANGKKSHRLFCSCCRGKNPVCEHARLLSETYTKDSGVEHAALFEQSVVRRLFDGISRTRTDSLDNLVFDMVGENVAPLSVRRGSDLLVTYLSAGADRARFIGRCLPGERMSRAWLMDRLLPFVESDYEQAMRSGGHRTVRQLEEAGLWTRIAYHCFREFPEETLSAETAVDSTTGSVELCLFTADVPVLKVMLPRKAVPGVLDSMLKLSWDNGKIAPAGEEYELYFNTTVSHGGDLHFSPEMHLADGVAAGVESRFCYGQFCYIHERKRFVRFTYASLQRIATGWNREIAVSAGEADGFLVKNLTVLSLDRLDATGDPAGHQQIDLFGNAFEDDLGRITGAAVLRLFDRVELQPQSMENGTWTIAVSYRCGAYTLPLAVLHEARRNRQRFCVVAGCIVDLKSERVRWALTQAGGIGSSGAVTLSGASLLLLGRGTLDVHFDGDRRLIKKIRQMFSGTTEQPFTPTEDLSVSLRDYQHKGVAWLLFLFDNYLGGLLCDEMGLGKTVQIIAFLWAVKRQREGNALFCVICPTSVMSHWARLINGFAPSLRVVEYTAATRSLPESGSCDVLLTTYGIMRNDAELLEERYFDVVVFDEVQQLKNSSTAGFKAAMRLRWRCAAGLTGTPVENSVGDLRTLFDLVLPGFSAELPDQAALADTLDVMENGGLLEQFKHRVAPFILRRRKQAVLTELPSKIETIRYCQLSPLQREFYSEALATRGSKLVETLKNSDEPIPYMHIFSLMSFLKQLCNTPALVTGSWEHYPEFASGKWELFTELLEESLESGEKVVVFTQFLDMVEIFKHYCASLGAGVVALTGSSRNRGDLLRRFAEDDDCRVFIGSLKAGGVGIDLVAASVVIHYDRWWNAAREDQATDRVHRIGQRRGVQVFKLVTENSIEERIAAIIDRKRELAELTLSEDDPETVKRFSREELMELLSGTG